MANEFLQSNVITPTDAISAAVSAAFVETDSVLPLITAEAFPDNTNVIEFRKSGKVEAQTVAENSAYTYDADSEITDTSVTVTSEKGVQAQKVSIEALRFGGSAASFDRMVREAARAHQRLIASKLKTLFSSVSGAVTATSTLTKDNLLDARYTVASSVMGPLSPKLVAMLDYKGMNELAKELTDTTASAFANQVDLGGVLGISKGAAPKGELFDIVLFETSGLPTSGGDDVGCVWDPGLAFCAGVDNGGFESEVVFLGTGGNLNYELSTWMHYKLAEWNDAAAVKLLSDT